MNPKQVRERQSSGKIQFRLNQLNLNQIQMIQIQFEFIYNLRQQNYVQCQINYIISDNQQRFDNIKMQGKTQRAIMIDEYGKKPYLKQDVPVPQLNEGQLLVKVEASTINPSDRIFLSGNYFKRPLPAICGIEGTGVVVQAKGQALQSWVGKRVCFTSSSGSWAEYSKASPIMTFEIDKDVPLSSAASGIVNPLTVVGFIEHYKTLGLKGGIIHTAAASALGRQLNKLCQKQKIPLLNIVRRQQHVEILNNQGAQNILVTEGQWQKQYKQYISKGFNCVYDALGGGPVTQKLICNLAPKSVYHLYGGLQQKPLTLTSPFVLFSGVNVTGFILGSWWVPFSEQGKNRVRAEYSSLLKNQLATKTYKELSIKDIDEALELSVSKATEGKVLLKIA